VDQRRLPQLFRGDVDWIVMKALEKDRNRRYESASSLAADVHRYLHDEAVEACPPSPWYRLRKFTRRNRRGMMTVGLIALALVAAAAVSTWQAIDANAARKLADERLHSEKRARTEAATKSAIANAVNSFLLDDLLRQAHRGPQEDSGFGGGQYLTVKEALDRAAATIGQRFGDQPLTEAAIRLAICDAYASLRWDQLAVPHVEKVVALRRATLGIDHPETLGSMNRLATAYGFVGRCREAVAIQEEILNIRVREFGPDHLTTIDSVSDLANACWLAGHGERAITLALQVLEKRGAVFGPSHEATVDAMHRLAMIYLTFGPLEESIAWCEKVLAITPDASWPLKIYARALQKAGRLDEADRQLRKVLEIARKLSDRRAREALVAVVQVYLGQNLLLQGRYDEAETVAREALAFWEKETPDTWQRFFVMTLVGGALMEQEKYAEAEPLLVHGYEGIKQREAFMTASFSHLLPDAGERLIRFYEMTNQPEKVRAWRDKQKPKLPTRA
jgi:tetratricopeptide (TPR) repeat protein